MRKAVIFAIISAISHFAWAQTDVSTYIPGITSDAVTYYLPETTLRIAVTVTERTYTPGEFCRYAERYLKTSGLSDKVERSWSIENISVTFYGTPDPQNIYSVKVNGKSIAPNVQLTGEGILAAINTSRPEQSAPAEAPVSEPSGINPKDYLTEEILMAGSTAKMAELTAKEIFNIRESRNAITRGQADYVPSDGESFRYILDNLDKQEKALLQLFNGTTTFKEHIQEISFTPQNEESGRILFRMSEKLGLVDSLNLAGSPVYISISNLNAIPQTGTDIKKPAKKENGIPYRLPGRASIKIYDSTNTWYDAETEIAQFGNIATLPASLLTKSADSRIIFDTATGNVVSIESNK